MDLISIIVIAIGLAMDCFAVSISKGVCSKKFHTRYALRMALLFGFFQGAMPLLGYFVGTTFAEIISRFDHWVAFGLLGLIGGKMIIEGISKKGNECNCVSGGEIDPIKEMFNWRTVITLAIATSIDALATGLIFVPFPDLIWIATAVIALVSLIFSLLGVAIGANFGNRFKINVNVIGGLILIIIGSKILFEHLFF